MRSRLERRAIVGALAAWLLIAPSRPLHAGKTTQATETAAPGADRATAGMPDGAAIKRALEAVKADPNLATEMTIKTLKWRGDQPKPERSPMFAWLRDLFMWLDGSARALMWVGATVLALWLGSYLYRLVRDRRGRGRRRGAGTDDFVAPTHVRDLDIRPEALPADIGAAARALWDRGESRAALALLYRGLLSRLAHVHRVPIRDSSTEGDCLALAAQHLPEARRAYASRLVRVWQRAVYGSEALSSTTVYELCDAFAAALDAPREMPAAPAAGGAA